MKVVERLAIIDRIGRELQNRYSFKEIDQYLVAHFIRTPHEFGASKLSYVKDTLAPATHDQLAAILDDLDLGSLPEMAAALTPPANWRGTQDFRLFISHISKDKDKAQRLKACLAPYKISGFVAHEDIEPTREWQVEVERALFAMDAMVAVHTKGFSQSFWTQQEIGFALGRGVKVISFKMDEDPTGFISKRQALSRGTRTAEAIAEEIDSILRADPNTAKRLENVQGAQWAADLDDEIPF